MFAKKPEPSGKFKLIDSLSKWDLIKEKLSLGKNDLEQKFQRLRDSLWVMLRKNRYVLFFAALFGESLHEFLVSKLVTVLEMLVRRKDNEWGIIGSLPSKRTKVLLHKDGRRDSEKGIGTWKKKQFSPSSTKMLHNFFSTRRMHSLFFHLAKRLLITVWTKGRWSECLQISLIWAGKT